MSDVGDNTHAHLKATVEKIERLEEEIKELNGMKSEVYAEAKANGFDVKVLKKLIAIRRKDPSVVQEEDAILQLYKEALGMSA